MVTPLDSVPAPDLGATDLSILGLFLHADIVVKSIMIGLAIASIVCWTVIFEKSIRMWRLSRQIKRLEAAAQSGALPADGAGGLEFLGRHGGAIRVDRRRPRRVRRRIA